MNRKHESNGSVRKLNSYVLTEYFEISQISYEKNLNYEFFILFISDYILVLHRHYVLDFLAR